MALWVVCICAHSVPQSVRKRSGTAMVLTTRRYGIWETRTVSLTEQKCSKKHHAEKKPNAVNNFDPRPAIMLDAAKGHGIVDFLA